MKEREDSALVVACLRGDDGSFAELVRRYEKPLYNLAYRMSGNSDDAQDIAQSAFVKAYEKLTTFDTRRKFFSWLYRIALNEALNYKRTQHTTHDQLDQLTSPEITQYDRIEQDEEQARIQESLYALDENLRAVIVLHYFAECSYTDISYILGVPERTIKSRLHSARERLRHTLRRTGRK